jgi:hypothetical protein
MGPIKRKLARKAVKSTAKHSAHGTAAKLKQEPMRTATLLALGCAAGVFGSWMAGRRSASPAPG